jgi:MOSC domain-containing protein YiiM
MDLSWGMFGENFTSAGLYEAELNIGDKFRIGSAQVMVTEPRMPCFKLGIRFGNSGIIRKFLQSERTGFYLAVLREGEVTAGDEFELIERNRRNVRVSDITRLYVSDKHNKELLGRAIEAEALPESWRSYFQNRLEKLMES